MLSRTQLETYQLSKLQEELQRYGIQFLPQGRTKCIDLLIELYQNKNRITRNTDQLATEAESLADSPVSSAAHPLSEVSHLGNDSRNLNLQKPSNSDPLAQLCTLLSTHIQQQNQHAHQQKEMLSEMMSALSVSNVASRHPIYEDQLPPPLQEQNYNTASTSQVPETFSLFSSNAAKFFSSQIPQFGETEDENVELWVEKLERVARIHGFPFKCNALSSIYLAS